MQKDKKLKIITGCLDVFSDICNVNLFEGENRIRPDALVPMKTDSVYTDRSGKEREHRRDVCMKHVDSGVSIAIFNVENQSDVCNIMPVRVLGYQYSGYLEQIDKLKQENERQGKCFVSKVLEKNQKLIPIVSLVLYYGTKEWDGPMSIMEMLDIPEKWRDSLESMIDNHTIRLIDLSRQDEETRKAYKSDFRHIVDYLHYISQRDKEKLQAFSDDESRTVMHPREFLMAMSAITSDRRYAEIAEKMTEEEAKEEKKMCMMLDIREERGEKRGMDRGIQRVNQLILKLAEEGRQDDILRIAMDREYEKQLMENYGIE